MVNPGNRGRLACTLRPGAFTLLEVVLAIGLSVLVLLILTMAIHQFLFRTEACDDEVVTAQLARALLNRMADDLRAAQLPLATANQTSPDQEYAEQESTGQESTEQESTEQESTGSLTTASTEYGEVGIIGTQAEVRIDRAARWQWGPVPEQDSSEVPQEAFAEQAGAAPTLLGPQSVHYFLRSGEPMSAAQLAQRGSQETSTDSVAGLYLESWPTTQAQAASGMTQSPATGLSMASLDGQLLAPEVIGLEFAYTNDAGELLEQWDSTEQGGLPRAVQIRLTLRTESPTEFPGTQKSNPSSDHSSVSLFPNPAHTVTYRLVVQLPDVRPLRSGGANSTAVQEGSSGTANSSGSTNSQDSTNSAEAP